VSEKANTPSNPLAYTEAYVLNEKPSAPQNGTIEDVLWA
jgi:hypothetical protein